MVTRKMSGPVGRIFQLKITLRGVDPPVWRRIQVAGSLTLDRLHEVFQIAVGWENAHLYRFAIGGKRYGMRDVETQTLDAKGIHLEDLAKKGSRFQYLYDFGDSWEHVVAVEDLLAPDTATTYPHCLAGERLCPPEDCGGPAGYWELLQILRDPDHEDYPERKEWAGPLFNPDAPFVPEQVNRILRKKKSLRM